MTDNLLSKQSENSSGYEIVQDSVFSEILKGLKLGIIVLDIKNRSVFFYNHWARDILKDRINPDNYDELCTMFLPGGKMAPGDDLAVSDQRQIRLGSSILGYTVYNPLDTYLSILLQDITEKERLESIAEAVETTNNLGYIFSQIRHELGNPTNSIKMTLEVLRSNINSYSKETILTYVERAQADLLRVEYLLKFLRNFSLYEDLDIRSHNMHAFMKSFLTLVNGAFHENGIRLNTVISPDAGFGLVDSRAMQQVMLNLFSNAVDAVLGSSCPEITISMKKTGKLVLIIFEDNGCGIPEKDAKKMFTAFFTTKPNGTGLGLTIAARVLARMNSTIEISSVEKVGSTVTISIPEGNELDAVGPEQLYADNSQQPW